ncbi:MAG: molybdate ABC transporter substrate-binding protein [Betaproteobacteria bacterium]|jgi:molybdate transport system substrate-binding protein|nr:molybdate ABC transporter substrate-binding protein [Betaproteobacteria bacterium]
MKPILILLMLALNLAPVARAADVPNIAAAADLKFALTEIAAAHTQAGGARVNLSFGSSGIFRRQIAQGAPFELFLSADEAYVAALIAEDRAEGPGTLYAIGRIVLFLPNGSPVKADSRLRDLVAAARDGRLKRLAIANPEHAPYGRAAREALQHVGAWDAVADKLALGENAAQAARFGISGSTQAAILPLSLVRNDEFAGKGGFVTLPESWHAPLRQRMVLVKGAGNAARRFHDFLQTGEARALFAKHGFVLPPAGAQ